jgi:hypothetical protein
MNLAGLVGRLANTRTSENRRERKMAVSAEKRMNRLWYGVIGSLLAGTVPTESALGQALVPPERIASESQLFETGVSARQLRCEFHPVRPALNFAFRFETGYTIDIPLTQIHGAGHSLTVHLRVRQEGREPAYLTRTGKLPDVPETKAFGETGGTFIVGDGTYDVEALAEDDLRRSCRGAWQIQARRVGSERQLKSTTLPGLVEELTATSPSLPDAKSLPRIARLTVLMHAAPLSPNLSTLQPGDIQTLVDSLTSLLRELPAQSVRLIAFNLDQRAIAFRKDGFEASQMGDLKAALQQMDLAKVDYRTLQQNPEPLDLLLGLVQEELRNPKPPDALIVLGPRTRIQKDVAVNALAKLAVAVPPIFFLQCRTSPPEGGTNRALRRSQGPLPGQREGDRRIDYGTAADGFPLEGPQLELGELPDSLERLMRRLKGETIPIRTPHDLADAIRHIDPRIPKTAAPAEVAAKVEPAAQSVVPDPSQSAPAADPTGDEDPVEVLIHLRDQVLRNGERIPNHTCVEMVQRDRYEPIAGRAPSRCDTLLARRKQSDFQGQMKLDSTDWLHLDVALISDREIYSWAGASKFENGAIDELVPEGAIGTGAFAAMLLSIVDRRYPNYLFEGETTVAGRRLFEYSFAVPQAQSHYRVRADKEWIISGYTGTLQVDPKTSQLVRVLVRTDELPAATNSCENDTTLEYGVVQLDGGDYLLPTLARQRFIGRMGTEDENTLRFSACRQYKAESRVVFDVRAPISGGQGSISPKALDLPGGLPVTVELMTPVRIGEASAGDPIEGRLAKSIRDEQQNVLVAEGAMLQGRLMRVETVYSPHVEHTVALRWERIRIDGEFLSLSLLPNHRSSNQEPISASGTLRRRGIEIELPLPRELRYAVFHPSGERLVLESGLRSEWLTAKP